MKMDASMNDNYESCLDELRRSQSVFAVATIVRTVGITAAKPGAKAILDAQGNILCGFLGGGCVRGAVRRSVVAAIETGQPKLVSVTPDDNLTRQGVQAGQESLGVLYARNGCPSEGTIDVFIEPHIPNPEVVVIGQSPVARALERLAPVFGWRVGSDVATDAATGLRAIVIATQGNGDMDALKSAIEARADHIAFVGSRKKFAALGAKLTAQGVGGLDRVKAPAGLDLGAVTAEEIALSIMAELVMFHRAPVRGNDYASAP